MPKISIIAALAENGTLGNKGRVPWDITEDVKHFRKLTLGHPVIMGKKTFESLGSKPLPNRINIVLTTDKSFEHRNVYVANSLESAIKIAKKLDREEIFIIGGVQVFKKALENIADYMYLTQIHKEYQGDVFFPRYSSKKWQEVSKTPEDTKKPRFTFVELKRID